MPSYVTLSRLVTLRFADEPAVTAHVLRRWAVAGRLPGARKGIGGGWMVDLDQFDAPPAPQGVRSLSEILSAAGYGKAKKAHA
jgi:hypothetical protein